MISYDTLRKVSFIVILLLLIVDIYLRYRESDISVLRMITRVDERARESRSSASRNVTSDSPNIKSQTTATSRWTVISLAVSPTMGDGYVFYLPLTVAAWKRIGWHSFILITGDIHHWSNSNLLNLVKQTTLDLDSTARFVTIPVTHNPVSYAQVSRSFAVLFARWIQPDDIVMTSDIDIVPLKGEFYDKVRGNEIFILNADCCGSFSWRGESIRMQPMTSIGMSARNWMKVMDLKKIQENELFELFVNSWLHTHYGRNISKENVEKDENENWYIDQRVVSIQLHHSNIKQNKIRRRTVWDRVDRAYSRSWRNFKHHVDAHVYLDPLSGKHWNMTMMLIKAVFTRDVANQLKQFKDNFVSISTKT